MEIKNEIIFKTKTKKMITKVIEKKISRPKAIHRVADYESECDER